MSFHPQEGPLKIFMQLKELLNWLSVIWIDPIVQGPTWEVGSHPFG
jgi:hypothetical protein